VGEAPNAVRVALLAGTLARGGAEKQLVYMARALREAGVCVRVYTLGKDDFYEAALRDVGLAPIGVGRAGNPVLRLGAFTRALWSFHPHVVQAGHFYVNLYVALASRFLGSLAIGAIRNDAVHELQENGRWGPYLLRMPTALLANSHTARRNAVRLGVDELKIHVVPNVIDPAPFRRAVALQEGARNSDQVVVILVARLVPAKRVDRFLEALALARRSVPELRGVVVGVGPERASLEAVAQALGLTGDAIEFHGASDDLPRLMAHAHMFALTSDHEGVPNTILEAMSAGLPVVTTPAGDAGTVVQDGTTGYVVPFDAVQTFAERMVRLARSPDLRRRLGDVAYEHVNERYSCAGLAARLVSVYTAVAQRSGRDRLLGKLGSAEPRMLGHSVTTTGATERTR
jgi:glycosyltransferase involved in cell wall biosynthesis